MPTGRPDHTGSVVIQGTVSVQGTVSISGPVTVQGEVLITNSQINIATLGADNIIIDLLKEDAWQERRATISNDDGVSTTHTNAQWWAKVFSRGCRGFIHKILFRLKNTYMATSSKTDTTDTDFDAGSFYQTERIGTGAAASVKLAASTPGANFGNTSIGSTNYPTENYGDTTIETAAAWGRNYVFADQKITITYPTTFVKAYYYSGVAQDVRIGLYSDSAGSPSTKLAETALEACTAGAWHEFTLSTPYYLSPGTYWIAFIFSADNTLGNVYKKDVGEDKYMAKTYDGTLPTTFTVSGTQVRTCSVYIKTVRIMGYIKATKAVLSTSGNVQGLKFYAHASGCEVRVAIYDNASPKALKWQGIISATQTGWNDIPISAGSPTSLYLAAGTYWVCWQVNTTAAVPSYTAGSAGDGWYLAYTYGSYPSTITGETSSSEKWSEYGYIVGAYYTTGTFTSAVIDTASATPDFTTMLGNCTVPTNTTIKYQFKAGSTLSELNAAAFEGPTGPSDYFTVNTSQDIPSKWDNKRYCQYKFYFETTDTSVTPSLDDITVNWQSLVPLTMTVYVKPFLTSGPIFSLTSEVPGGQDGWHEVEVNRYWSYDSCVIIIYCSNANLRIYYDNDEPYDSHQFIDPVNYWASYDGRIHIRIQMSSLTVGDVPVSGIINNVQIPNVSNMVAPTGDWEVASGGTKEWLDVYGMGTLQWLVLRMYSNQTSNQSPAYTKLHVYVDDTDIFGNKKIYDFEYVSPAPTQTGTAGTLNISSLPWGWWHINPTAADDSVFFIAYPIQFLKRLRIVVENTAAFPITYVFACSYQLVS
jgi:hypothetical protein